MKNSSVEFTLAFQSLEMLPEALHIKRFSCQDLTDTLRCTVNYLWYNWYKPQNRQFWKSSREVRISQNKSTVMVKTKSSELSDGLRTIKSKDLKFHDLQRYKNKINSPSTSGVVTRLLKTCQKGFLLSDAFMAVLSVVKSVSITIGCLETLA